jgi:hypothetical protein
MSSIDYNKIISTINSVQQDYTYTPDTNNLICIDTSNNRIGINTLDPQYSLHISGGTLFCPDISTINITINTINGEVYSSNSNLNLTNIGSNVIPFSNNTYKLGTVDRSWSNAYIRDLSVTSVDISENILPLRNNSSNLGSSIKRWNNIFANDISVNKINGTIFTGITINSLTNNGTLLDISKGQIYAKTISAETISVTSDILLYDISLKSKINAIINRVNDLSSSLTPIPTIAN